MEKTEYDSDMFAAKTQDGVEQLHEISLEHGSGTSYDLENCHGTSRDRPKDILRRAEHFTAYNASWKS